MKTYTKIINGKTVTYKTDEAGRVFWSDDWATLVTENIERPFLRVVNHGPATYNAATLYARKKVN